MSKETLVSVDSERIKRLLKTKGKNKSQMATELLISREHLYRQLSKGVLSIEWLKKIANYLDVNEEYLTGESNIIEHPSRDKAFFERIVDKFPDLVPHGVRREFYLYCFEQLDPDRKNIEYIQGILEQSGDYERQRFLINDALEHIDDYVKMKFKQLIDNLRKEGENNGSDDQIQ